MKKNRHFERQHAALKEIADQIANALQNNFIGFYVFGSLAKNDWDRERSDIDFVVVTKKSVRHEESTKLQKLHQTIYKERPIARKLEGEYLDLESLQRKNFDQKTSIVIGGKFRSLAQCQISADNIFDLIQHGRAVQGKPISTLRLQVTKRELRYAFHAMLREDLRALRPMRTFESLYATLINGLRSIFSLRTNRLPSKRRAIMFNRHLLGEALYRQLLAYQRSKTKRFPLNKTKVKSILTYGLTLKP